MSNMTILKALERMGFKGRMTGHRFRALASAILHEQGYYPTTTISSFNPPTRLAPPLARPTITRCTRSQGRE